MKRVLISLALSILFVFGYGFLASGVFPNANPGLLTPGAWTRDYIFPRYGYETEREIPYDETKAVIVFLTVNIVVYAIPIYLILSILNRRKVV